MRHIVASCDDLLHTIRGDIFPLGKLEDLLLPSQEQEMTTIRCQMSNDIINVRVNS